MSGEAERLLILFATLAALAACTGTVEVPQQAENAAPAPAASAPAGEIRVPKPGHWERKVGRVP